MFWSNRLIPADFAGREAWEIRVFFIVWAGALARAQVSGIRKRRGVGAAFVGGTAWGGGGVVWAASPGQCADDAR
jgi:hypothetical protein